MLRIASRIPRSLPRKTNGVGQRKSGSRTITSLHEDPLFPIPPRFTEHQLQAYWYAGDFGRDFLTVNGTTVRIVQFGVWNHQPGPDFAEAAVSFDGGEPVRGWIELDTDVRDWERHGHAANPEYEGVILHLFTQQGKTETFTRTLQHRQVPQVMLDLKQLSHVLPEHLPEAKPGRCIGPLRRLSLERVRAVLLGAAELRLKRKGAALATLRELHGSDEALYQALAATLGYKNNKLPFTLLAQRLPLRMLITQRSSIEALLFGVSGFLHPADFEGGDPETRVYLRTLWEQWWPRRAEFERLTIPRDLWKMGGQRPANHPQRRLAALAQIVRNWSRIRRWRKVNEPAEAAALFEQLRDPFWERHFTLTSRSSRTRMALIGGSRVTEILANVIYPLAVGTEEKHWAAYQKLPAALTNSRVKIAAIRLFADSPHKKELLKSAALQQGLLQLYEDFCMHDASDCARCRFPEQLANW